VKVIRCLKDKLVLQLGRQERHVLLAVLKLYPRIPPSHHRISRSGAIPNHLANQKLLDEALVETRAENKNQLQAFLTDPTRFEPTQHGTIATLTHGDLEWLMQILNDIRVGSWLLLGCPEDKLAEISQETAPHAWAMEMAGYFEGELLEALEAGPGELPAES